MTVARHDEHLQDRWTLTEGEGPLVALALHDGHELRPEVAALVALSDDARLREEDPFTGAWAAVAPTRLVARHSRFEVDLNRPRARAVYVHPEDAWGLKVWRSDPPAELVQRSLAAYDAFFDEARRVLDRIVEREGHFVVFDLHTYNHRRAGPGARFDAQTKHPDVNIGTGTMHRARWAPVVDRLVAELRGCDHLGRQLDVRENIKFYGGAFTRWVHETYPESGCSIAVELKKFFMDEWTGQLYADLHHGIQLALQSAADAVCEELGKLAPPPPVGEDRPVTTAASEDYGHFMVGVWRCGACGWQTFPRQLMQKAARRPFRCERCESELGYSE